MGIAHPQAAMGREDRDPGILFVMNGMSSCISTLWCVEPLHTVHRDMSQTLLQHLKEASRISACTGVRKHRRPIYTILEFSQTLRHLVLIIFCCVSRIHVQDPDERQPLRPLEDYTFSVQSLESSKNSENPSVATFWILLDSSASW